MLPNLPKSHWMSLAHKQLKSHRSPRQPECNQTSCPSQGSRSRGPLRSPLLAFSFRSNPALRLLDLLGNSRLQICNQSQSPPPKIYLTSMLPHNLFVCTVTRTCNEQDKQRSGGHNKCARTDLEGDDKPPKPTSREHRRMHWGFAACFLLAKKRPSLFMSAPRAAVNSGSVGRGFFFVCLSIFGSGPIIRSILVSARAQGIDKYRTGLTIRCVLVRGQCKFRCSVFITNKGPSMEILRFESTRRAIRF